MHFLQLTDRLVIIEIATFHSRSDGQLCSGQIRPQSASDHWEQIWMNFNWKSWKMLSAGHWVIYDITLIPGVSAKNGSNCSTEEKCKQWMRNIKCTFRLLGYHCQKLWKDLDFETCLIMVASGWSAQIWQRLSIFPTKGFYHLRTNISIRLLSLSVSVLGIILTSLHCVVLPLV